MILALLIRIKLDCKPSQLSVRSATELVFQSEPYLLSNLILLKLTHELILHTAQYHYASIAIIPFPNLVGLEIPSILSSIAMLRLS